LFVKVIFVDQEKLLNGRNSTLFFVIPMWFQYFLTLIYIKNLNFYQ